MVLDVKTMAELKDKELEEVNGAGKAQMDAWDLVFKTFNPAEDEDDEMAVTPLP